MWRSNKWSRMKWNETKMTECVWKSPFINRDDWILNEESLFEQVWFYCYPRNHTHIAQRSNNLQLNDLKLVVDIMICTLSRNGDREVVRFHEFCNFFISSQAELKNTNYFGFWTSVHIATAYRAFENGKCLHSAGWAEHVAEGFNPVEIRLVRYYARSSAKIGELHGLHV